MSDRYQTISAISSSRAGVIHRGWDKHQNRDVSIQRIAAQGEAAEEVLREARALYGLRHPNIATAYEYGRDDEGVYVVQEMIKGKSLDTIIAQRPLNAEEFDLLVRQSLAALQEAHSTGLIHRNLTPISIMVPWNAQNAFAIKLTNFSLGAPLDPAAPKSTETDYHLAPEQFGNAAVTLRADLYSLGTILYYALTQQHAFQGSHSGDVVIAHLYHRHIPLKDLRPDLSEPLCAWVERLMMQSPAERPATAEEALQMYRMIPEDEVLAVAPVEDEPVAVPLLEPDEVIEEPQVLEEATPFPEEPEPEAEPPEAPHAEPEAAPEAAVAAAELQYEAAVAAPEPEYEQHTPSPVIHEPEEPVAAVSPAPSRQPVAQRQADAGHATARSLPPTQKVPRRRSAMNLILVAFGVVMVGMLVLVSVLKHSSQDDRLRRLAELGETEKPQGSDLDVRMLLDFLEVKDQREPAALLLERLQGGEYIDQMLVEHIGQSRAFDASVRLVQIIGQRRVSQALPKLLPLTNNPSAHMRKAAWTALGKIASDADLPALIATIDTANAADSEEIENAVVAAVETAGDRAKASETARQSYERAKTPATRAILLNVLMRVGGGPEVLTLIEKAIADPSEDVRRAAIVVLAKYPTHDPLTAITARFPEEPDSACRAYLLLAAKELVTKPGASSQETLARQAQSLFANAKTESERDRALSAISGVIAPATATFYETFAEQDDPRLRREALALAAAFTQRLQRVVAVQASGEATPIPAANADLTLGGNVTLEQDVLQNWTQLTDQASWLVQVPKNGKFEVSIYQAHAASETGTYEVMLAGETIVTAAVSTGSDSAFKGFIIGEFEIAEPGTYRLTIKPRKIPEGGELMRVQKLAIKAL